MRNNAVPSVRRALTVLPLVATVLMGREFLPWDVAQHSQPLVQPSQLPATRKVLRQVCLDSPQQPLCYLTTQAQMPSLIRCLSSHTVMVSSVSESFSVS